MLDWMAWTWPTAVFFGIIVVLLTIFTVLAVRYPETPRRGMLRIETTRGDRLFIALLGSGFINIAWLWAGLGPQYLALVLCLVFAVAVFRYV